jgi:outer membrane lipase/esterase
MKRKLLVLAFSFAVSHAAADQFNQFISFGDSNLDSGWWKGALQVQCDRAPAPCTTGSAVKNALIANAIANGGTGAPVGVGLMNSQILAGFFGLTAVPANQPGGTNYAISGAVNAATPANGNIGNLNLNKTLPSTMQQIANYLSLHGGVANPQALYVISSGGK